MSAALPSYPLRAAHLTAVWAYAVSQPAFSLLEGNPEFLVVRGSTRVEVIVFAVLLTVTVPLLVLASEWLLSRFSRVAADALHLLALAAFAVPFVLALLKRADPGPANAVLIAVAIGLIGAGAYQRSRYVRSFLTFSLLLPALGFVAFVARVPLVTDDVAGASVRVPNATPIVVVVFDEFPISSLMTVAGAIDAFRYPRFAQLATEATWYPRATTTHESSTAAVPGILTGRLPRKGSLPTLKHHPENLFTLLGETYDVRALETATHLCPDRYCPRTRDSAVQRLVGLLADVRVGYLHRVLPESLRGGLPDISDRWGGFAQERILAARDPNDIFAILGERVDPLQETLDAFLGGLAPGEPAATLHFVHLLLPHSPWRFLPSGRAYGERPATDGIGPNRAWIDDTWVVQQDYQRHLLQVAYTDSVLGRILDRLRRSGLYDGALVVVVADHGVSFAPGRRPRDVDRRNVADIAGVPLFVKFPGQRTGRVDMRVASTVDIVPTIADVLGLSLPWRVDGHSLLRAQAKRTNVSVRGLAGRHVRVSPAVIERGVERTARRKTAFFGEGRDSLYAIGPYKRLLGRVVGQWEVASDVRARIDDDLLFEDVQTSSSFLPTRVTGAVEGDEDGLPLWYAVVVNGHVAAVTRRFHSANGERFAAQIAEATLVDGANRVALFAIRGAGSRARLVLVERAP